MTTGTIEEKIFQRQLSKEGLQNVVEDKEEANSFSTKDLRDLFRYRPNTVSDTLENVYRPRGTVVGADAGQGDEGGYELHG